MLQRSVLIIDDCIDDYELCERGFASVSDCHYNLHHVTSCDAALSYLGSNKPDCIFLDYSMPGHSAANMIESIRNMHLFTPIVIFTGQGSEAIAVKLLRCGAQDYLVKNTITSDVLHKITSDAITQCESRSQQNQLDSPTVLIIDDNPDDRDLIIRYLDKISTANYQYLEAESGNTALATLEECVPHCILLDYSLPGHNGLMVLQHIASSYPFLPIILMTGQGNEKIAVSAIKEGAQNYLIKSELTPDILHSAIHSAIEKSMLSRTVSEAEQKLQLLYNSIEQSNDMLLITNADLDNLQIQYVNDHAAQRITGYTAAELMGQSPKLFQGEETDKATLCKLRKELAKGQEYECEVINYHKDGTSFWQSLNIAPIKDASGKVEHFVAATRDITERELLINQLRASNEDLERFAYIASHDLQEPLRMVVNFTELLSNEYHDQLDAQAQQYIAIASDAAQRMQGLINDLLEYSRIYHEAERLIVVNCQTTLNAAMENLREPIKQQQAIITSDPLPSVMTNPIRLTRLFQNLIGNALKYMKEDTKPVIHIGCYDEPRQWVFSVSDNGIGIKEAYFQRIFTPFKRLHTQQEFQGTGIGLSVCKKIIENLGGKIWVTSEFGVGSTFYFTINKNMAEGDVK